MVKKGYVSFGVALCAALGVHALVLLLTYQQDNENLIVGATSLQVTLLPQVSPEQVNPTIQQVEKVAPKRVETKPEQLLVKQEVLVTKTEAKHTYHYIEEDVAKAVEPEEESSPAEEVMLVPELVQQAILIHIYYPRQARRRGWEGKAELQFQVHEHVIKDITVLVSTGHTLLDETALQGLASMKSLALNDGNYWLPIVFQLQ